MFFHLSELPELNIPHKKYAIQLPLGTESVKLPSKSVTVPFEVPISKIETPIRGSFNLESITLPFTVWFCAQAVLDILNTKNSNKTKRNVFILLYLELNKGYYYLLVRMDTVAGTNPGEVTFNIILPSFRVLFTTTIARPFHAFR